MRVGPSSAQRVVLSVLAEGGWIDPGTPGASCPRLYSADGRLFALIARSTLYVLRYRSWVFPTPTPIPGGLRLGISVIGLDLARRFRP